MEKITLSIDGLSVEADEGATILHAALQASIYIPHLCHHPHLRDVGECKMCVVEIEGREGIQTSCTTLAENGMVVKTKTDKLKHIRNLSMELMLASHPSECTSCAKYLKCEFQNLIQYMSSSDTRLRKTLTNERVVTENPLFVRDLNRCVLCGRCVRACQELRGCEVLNYKREGEKTYIGTANNQLLGDEDCRFCLACVEVCPTGALMDKEEVVSKFGKREEALLPCKASCPAGTNAQRYVRYIREGKYGEAVAVIREKAPFPLTLGYICMAFCETNCRRGEVNEAVSIRELKKFASVHDNGLWRKNSKISKPSGKKVAVIGGGPAGLTSAYYLAKQGHEVTIYEKLPYAGGMMRVGIPEYRLPRTVVSDEIKEIENVGVKIKTNTEIKSLERLFEEGHSAVLVAIGNHKGVRLPIEGNNLEGVLVNTDFLREVNLKHTVNLGERVVVLGGGNVAFDCARVAKRLGAKEVHIACLEDREHMTASMEEIEKGTEEGILLHNSKTFHRIVSSDESKVIGVECSEVASFHFDENGKLILEIVPASKHVLSADTVIFATGQKTDLPEEFGLLTGRGNNIAVNGYETSKKGVFAAGDDVLGTSSVIQAIAEGRGAAIAIDKYLGGNGVIDEVLAPMEEPNGFIGRYENFAHKQRQRVKCEPVDKRIVNFEEFEHVYEEEAAHCESERCLQCDLRLKIEKPKLWGDYNHH